MSLRTGMNAPAVLIDKYINSAYDTVRLVADNIQAIIDASALVGAYMVSDTVPATRSDGDALREGDRWYNTTTDTTYVYDGAAWKVMGSTATVVEKHVATTNQTNFVLANPYVPNTNNILVFIDGVYQISKSIDAINGSYTESNTTQIVFDTQLPLNTQVIFVIGTVITDASTVLSVTKKVYTAIDDVTQLVTIPDAVTYTVGENVLSVYVNGLIQLLGDSYTETNSTQITFTEALTTGDKVLFTITTVV